MIDQYLLLIEQIELEDEYRDRLLLNEGVVGSLVEKIKGVIKWFIDKILGTISKIAGIFRKKSKSSSSSSSSNLNIDKDAGKKAISSVIATSKKVDAEVEKKKKELFGDGSGEYAYYTIDDVNTVIECVKKAYEIMINDFSDTGMNTWGERFKKLESNIENEVNQAKQNNSKANMRSIAIAKSNNGGKDIKATFYTLRAALNMHKNSVSNKIDKLSKSLKSISTPTKRQYTSKEMDEYYNKVEVAFTGKKNSREFVQVTMGDATSVVLNMSNNKEYIKRSSALNSYYNTAMATVKSLNNLIESSADYIDPKSSENITNLIKAYADYSKSIISTTTFFLQASTKLDSIGRGLHLRF